MFERDSTKKLAAILDHICVPMFVAERTSPDEDFVLAYVNNAHEKASGFRARDVAGSRVQDLLPPDEAATVNRKFALCADTGVELRYTEQLTTPKGRQDWDTTLQHVPMAEGRDRIIGASFQITCHDARKGAILVFDDIRYFAAVADFQLQNLVSMFDAAEEEGLFSQDSEQRVAQLGSMCRSVMRAVEDIRNVVDRASPHPGTAELGALIRAGTTSRNVLENAGGEMLRVLNEAAKGAPK